MFEVGVNHANDIRRCAGLYHVCNLEDPVAVALTAAAARSGGIGTVVLVERDADLKRLVKSVESVLPLELVEDYIRQGSVCYKKDGREEWTGGVSTIGNTLPRDIVEALREFRPVLSPRSTREPNPVAAENFYRDADYEFCIPEEIQEPIVCPCNEEVEGAGEEAGEEASREAVAVAAPSNEVYVSSESSDSEDD